MGKRNAEVVYGDPERKEMKWFLDADGVLYLSGQGRIPSTVNEKQLPWSDKKDQILCVRVASGVTELGVNAFKDCMNLKKVVLPDSLKRIHSGCFCNCKNLTEIKMNDKPEFHYVYESQPEERVQTSKSEKRQLIFGVRSFYGVPWMIRKFGDYYVRDGILYACFKADSHVSIPKEVHTISRFAFSDTDVESVEFHEEVENIEMMAFSNTKLTSVRLPEGLKLLAPYAFAGSPITYAQFTHNGEAEISELCFEKTDVRYPRTKRALPDGYELVLRSAGPDMPDFQLFKVRKKRPKNVGVLVRDTLNVGQRFCRRIENGSAIVGICYDEVNKKVLEVRSYRECVYEERTLEYRLHPCYGNEEETELAVWKESFYYRSPIEMENMFYVRSVSKELERETDLRSPFPGVREQWFLSKPCGATTGDVREIRLLKQWLAANPDYRVNTLKECEKEYLSDFRNEKGCKNL